MKKLLVLLLALSLLVSSMFVLASCNDNGDKNNEQENNNTDNNNNENNGGNTDNTDDNSGKIDYTVKVVDQDGNGVPGIPVTLGVGPKNKYDLVTDTNGVATHKMAETTLPMYAELGILPEGYGEADAIDVNFAAGAKTATLEVVKQVAYKVTFVNSDGNGVAGVLAQVCVGDTCMSGKTTGETGVLIFYVAPGSENVSMQINTIPTDYSQSLAQTKQYYEDGSFEITITLEDAATA